MTDTMTAPTRTNDKTKWLRRLKGEQVVTHPDDPDYGYYRVPRGKNDYDPVAYWYDDDGTLRCLIRGREVDSMTAREKWTWACERPITFELYEAVLAGGAWPDLNEVVTRSNQAPADDSIEGLTQRIEDLTREAQRMIDAGAAKTKDAADQAADVANKLGDLQKKADTARETEKRPHLQACRDVDDKWRPVIALADIYKKLKAVVLDPFLIAERRRKEEAERKAREEAEAAARTGSEEQIEQAQAKVAQIAETRVTAGSRGRSVGLRSYNVITIEDRAKVIDFFKDRQEMTELLQKLAERAVKAGVDVPGVKVTKEQRSA